MMENKRITKEALRLYPVNINRVTNAQKRTVWIAGVMWAVDELEHAMLVLEGEKVSLEAKLTEQVEKANYWHSRCKFKLKKHKKV